MEGSGGQPVKLLGLKWSTNDILLTTLPLGGLERKSQIVFHSLEGVFDLWGLVFDGAQLVWQIPWHQLSDVRGWLLQRDKRHHNKKWQK